jgi:hypothetical protein
LPGARGRGQRMKVPYARVELDPKPLGGGLHGAHRAPGRRDQSSRRAPKNERCRAPAPATGRRQAVPWYGPRYARGGGGGARCAFALPRGKSRVSAGSHRPDKPVVHATGQDASFPPSNTRAHGSASVAVTHGPPLRTGHARPGACAEALALAPLRKRSGGGGAGGGLHTTATSSSRRDILTGGHARHCSVTVPALELTWRRSQGLTLCTRTSTPRPVGEKS